MLLSVATGHQVSVRQGMCTGEDRQSPLSTLEMIFVCVMGGFLAIVVFCTCYNMFLKSGKGELKRRPESTLEEIISAFSITGKKAILFYSKLNVKELN